MEKQEITSTNWTNSFKKAIELEPNESNAYFVKARCLEGIKDYKGAISNYLKAEQNK